MNKRVSHFRARSYLRNSGSVLLVPFLDILLILIGFFMISTSQIQKGKLDLSLTKTKLAEESLNQLNIDTALPPTVPSEQTLGETSGNLHLKIEIRDRNIKLSSSSNKILPRTIPLTDEQQIDRSALLQELKDIKQLYPKETELTLVADPHVPYHRLLALLDFLKSSSQDQELFTKVSLNPEEEL